MDGRVDERHQEQHGHERVLKKPHGLEPGQRLAALGRLWWGCAATRG